MSARPSRPERWRLAGWLGRACPEQHCEGSPPPNGRLATGVGYQRNLEGLPVRRRDARRASRRGRQRSGRERRATVLLLTRSIGLFRATAMVVGIIIGASIFVQPSEITRRVPTIGAMLLVWLLSGLLTFFGAL